MDNYYKNKKDDLNNTLILINVLHDKIINLDNNKDAQLKCQLCDNYIKLLGDFHKIRTDLLKETLKTIYREAKTSLAAGDSLADEIDEVIKIIDINNN